MCSKFSIEGTSSYPPACSKRVSQCVSNSGASETSCRPARVFRKVCDTTCTEGAPARLENAILWTAALRCDQSFISHVAAGLISELHVCTAPLSIHERPISIGQLSSERLDASKSRMAKFSILSRVIARDPFARGAGRSLSYGLQLFEPFASKI